MSRIRTTKPEFWTSEQVVSCSRDARLLFIGLWNFCDDAGIHPASPMRLKMEVFPADNCTIDDIKQWINELIQNGLLREYVVDTKSYLQVTGWKTHQRIDKPTYRYPCPQSALKTIADNSQSTRRNLQDNSTSPQQLLEDNSSIVQRTIVESSSTDRNGLDRKGKETIYCSELNKLAHEQQAESVITFILNTSDEYGVTQEKINEWQILFPAIDVIQVLRNAKAWCINNPQKRKTKNGILRFLNGWLSKEQNNPKQFQPTHQTQARDNLFAGVS